jgi:hypothetical protein
MADMDPSPKEPASAKVTIYDRPWGWLVTSARVDDRGGPQKGPCAQPSACRETHR